MSDSSFDGVERLLQAAWFLSVGDKDRVRRLIERLVTLTTKSDTDRALRDWADIMQELAWYTSDAARMLETADRKKVRHFSESSIHLRRDGAVQWVANATIETDPAYQAIDDECVVLRSWHDYISKVYHIGIGVRSLLEQISNNQRSRMRLDVAS